MLRQPHGSVPTNPLLAEPLYLAKYIERMGTGTRDMIRLCREAGLPEPEFTATDGFVITIRRPKATTPPVAPPVTPPVAGEVTVEATDPVTDPVTVLVADPVLKLLVVVREQPLAPSEIQRRLHLRHRPTFRQNYLHAASEAGLIERTIPDKPNSRLQKYRLTIRVGLWSVVYALRSIPATFWR